MLDALLDTFDILWDTWDTFYDVLSTVFACLRDEVTGSWDMLPSVQQLNGGVWAFMCASGVVLGVGFGM
jgi:hypothetical protein